MEMTSTLVIEFKSENDVLRFLQMVELRDPNGVVSLSRVEHDEGDEG